MNCTPLRLPLFWTFCITAWLLTACSSLPDDEATWVLKDLAAFDNPSYLKEVTSPPRRQQITYCINGNNYQADVYIPAQAPLAALVLSPGLARNGKDDSRLKAFATTLARSRFLILVPDLPNLRDLKVKEEDIQVLVDAFGQLQSLSRQYSATPIPSGLGAFSYAAGPAVLAAMDNTIRKRVDFVLGVGGYYDINQVITYFSTGYYRLQGQWQYTKPNPYGKWVFVLSNTDLLADAQDRETLYAMAERKLNYADADIDDLKWQLSEEGKSVLKLLENTNPEYSPLLIAKLPAGIRKQLDALNLANRDLSALKAKLVLLHGTDDSIIPYTESIALRKAVSAGQAELFLINGLAHVDLHPFKLDHQAAWRAISGILALRKPTTTDTATEKQ